VGGALHAATLSTREDRRSEIGSHIKKVFSREKVPHELFKFATSDENLGGPSSTRPERRTISIGLTEFGPPPKPHFRERF